MHLCTLLICLLWLALGLCNGVDVPSMINFTMSPSIIVHGITKSFSMKCSTTESFKGRVESIKVTHDGFTVAKLNPITAKILDGGLTVTTDGEKKHIELNWSNPEEMRTGVYKCFCQATDENGRHLYFHPSLSVKTRNATVSDVVTQLNSEVAILKKKDSQQDTHFNNKVAKLEQKNSQQFSSFDQIIRTCRTNKVAFEAAMSPSMSRTQRSRGYTVVYDRIITNIGGKYNRHNGHFTCTIPGIYTFNIHSNTGFNGWSSLSLSVNSRKITTAPAYGISKHAGSTGAATATVSLKINDVVKVRGEYPINKFHYNANENEGMYQSNTFSGFLVKADGC